MQNERSKCLVLNPETREGPYYLSRRSLWYSLERAPDESSQPRSKGEEKPFLLPEIKFYLT
jgi:hypothetical protein